ncbi:hypothetical protein TNCV_1700251 [Trichonephila clavipes]|nr:hypothetical protein TNCV_1700251 [Trichonephila clavipes]
MTFCQLKNIENGNNSLVSLENINNIEIPRRILVAFPEVIEIHGFADASERCYGAAVYCKSKKFSSGLDEKGKKEDVPLRTAYSQAGRLWQLRRAVFALRRS